MKAGRTVLPWIRRDEGANLVEAALLIVLIAVAVVLVLAWVGDQNGQLWESVPQAFEDPPPSTTIADDQGSSGGGSSGGGSSGGGSSGGADPDCDADPPPDDPKCEEPAENP